MLLLEAGEGILYGRVRPVVGDRLHLVREPENRHDANAVEVWWRNEYKLGHVPRYLARIVAPELDAGKALRAYVWNGGDGGAWSVDMLLVGPAVAKLHGQWLEREAHNAEYTLRMVARRRRRESTGLVHATVVDREQAERRRDRLAQAVSVFSRLPFEPDLPAVGEEASAEVLADRIGMSASTVHAVAKRLGIGRRVDRRGWYAWALPYVMTAELREALLDRCRKPRAIGRQMVGISGDRYAA
ncbi:HIRAN domain-containing protein [Aureimonas sp. N4]|uniref:HIRAN domain-containing protein n=1 Tax=Aureimonas sp. N4 TaxID=1638165 RepID=UPI00192CF44F|nr:HIRAN domain-containing protein [Aureimonas sp. N4]